MIFQNISQSEAKKYFDLNVKKSQEKEEDFWRKEYIKEE